MGNLKPLLEFLKNESQFEKLTEELSSRARPARQCGRFQALAGGRPTYQKRRAPRHSAGLPAKMGLNVLAPDSLRPFLIAGIFERYKRTTLVVTAFPAKVERLAKDLENFSDVLIFPDLEILPSEKISSNKETVAKRFQVLNLLKNPAASGAPPLVVTSIKTLMKRVPTPSSLLEPFFLKSQEEVDFDFLIEYLIKSGYERNYLVEKRGEFRVSGGIVDIFSPEATHPVRIEFLGDKVESLRQFNLSTQTSISEIKETLIFPCQEFSKEPRLRRGKYSGRVSLRSLFDYLPEEALILFDEPKAVKDEARKFWQEIKEERGPFLSPPEVFTFPQTLNRNSSGRARLDLTSLGRPPTNFGGPTLEEKGEFIFEGANIEPMLGKLDRLKHFLKELSNDSTLVFALEKGMVKRLGEILKSWQLNPLFPPPGKIYKGKINLIEGDLNQGFLFPSLKLYLLTQTDIFLKKRVFRQVRQTKEPLSYFPSLGLKPQDFAVHRDYGIARYEGIVQKRIDGIPRDYLLLQFAGADKVYVPIEQVKKVSRYLGPTREPPKLSRLRGGHWALTKRRVKKALKTLAFDLLKLYAVRKKAPGFAYTKDQPWQKELEETFPFEETPDQLQAINEVKKDMQSLKPMDRLVVGDVGYGKTEVAIRASFKAVLDGKQVLVLAPTTILVQQHYQNFGQRFAPFPVNLEVLSRFKPKREQQEILQRLREGKVDVVIGTHRLLGKDVLPKNLGLVVIDEEQRFGVRHKEHLRELKKTVDVLTLSATPIPRTLKLSLTGLRDLSIIDTPPEDRYPIFTYVGEYDSSLVKQAVSRELSRGGQVYYVHNRVETIGKVAEIVKELVPEAKIGIAHGEMPERELEKVMFDFIDRKYEILVTTTIIESGIDIPSVNTILAEEAENFGLAQLYQLRGRVGRGGHLAYAYFFFSSKILTATALERLKTISEFTDLGSGLKIALRDLEIRGAGNFLGPEQHGHLIAVGFELYRELLEEAVQELSGKPKVPKPEVKIDLPVKAYLSPDYIPEETLRIEAYREIAAIDTQEKSRGVERRLKDRYGHLPKEAQRLIEVSRIRALAWGLGVKNISWRKDTLILEGLKGKPLLFPKVLPEEILSFLKSFFNDIIQKQSSTVAT